jgi:hypothetical protein
MQWLYCWRCGEQMPMLDEDEFATVAELYNAAFRATPGFRQRTDFR